MNIEKDLKKAQKAISSIELGRDVLVEVVESLVNNCEQLKKENEALTQELAILNKKGNKVKKVKP